MKDWLEKNFDLIPILSVVLVVELALIGIGIALGVWWS